MKVHVHVYRLASKAEVDIYVPDSDVSVGETRAMEEALSQAKKGNIEFGEPDNQFMAVPFVQGRIEEVMVENRLSDMLIDLDAFPEYVEKALFLESEVRRLKSWVEDLQSGMYVNCVYCGHRYGPDDQVPVSMADVLKKHIEQCPQHPMSKLKSKVEKLANTVMLLENAIKMHRRNVWGEQPVPSSHFDKDLYKVLEWIV